ncbi:glycosyltransferase 87 family protein [Frankia tisae]|uniref:glycosyltransferase 87 family protein n=1 Tax=Frankia tisae TaxID=2950104 RepID=UPI0021C0B715|nr:glycosyltransferase 87 family protein [Frankia tisae]
MPVFSSRQAAAAWPEGADSGPRRTLPAILVGWCALAWGIAAKDGRYGAWAMAGVLLGVAAAALATVHHRPSTESSVTSAGGVVGPSVVGPSVVGPGVAGCGVAGYGRAWVGSWLLVALTVGLGPIVRHPRYYATGPPAAVADALAIIAGLLATAAILMALAPPPVGAGRRAGGPAGRALVAAGLVAARRALGSPALFWVVLGLAGAAGIATIRAAPAPRIDVFHLLQISTSGLTHGADMYRQQWAPNRAAYPVDGLFDVYPYLPFTSVLLAPPRLLLGDVRYGLLLALAVAAVCARGLATGRRDDGGVGGVGGAGWPVAVAVLPLLVVIFPESMYALQQSWTEPLLVACLAAMVLAVRGGHGRTAVVALALALATKQHVALLLPVAAAWPRFGPRRTAAAAGVGALLVVPWVLAGPGDFVDDAVWTNLHYRVLGHSLSVPGWAAHFGVTFGFGPAAVALVAAYCAAWRARGDATGFCLGAALVLLALNLMNKQTFFNHYTLPMGLLVLAAAALGAGGQRRVEKRSSDAPS